MKYSQNFFLSIGMICLFVILFYLVSPIIFPFVIGFAVAYVLDPAADKLEKIGLSRALATSFITGSFFAVTILILIILYPVIESQIGSLLVQIPHYLERGMHWFLPLVADSVPGLDNKNLIRIRDIATGFSDQALTWLADAFKNLWRGGFALFNFFSLIFITPVVTFYLIRDWDLIINRLDSLLPVDSAPIIREQARNIDDVLSGFVRGQGAVALILGLIFSVGWSLIGLEFGLVLGLIAGALALIPYVGAMIGFGGAFFLALLQYGLDPLNLGLVFIVFAVGQLLDGLFLTPHLVGGRIGLHPVWVIFALMAGGLLFGFVGILISVPLAAVVTVLVKYVTKRYKYSKLYLGEKGSQL